MSRVLVIDDAPHVREAIKLVLERTGYDVSVVADLGTGIARLAEEPFDVAIIELPLGCVDGVSAIARIRGDFPGIGIIAMTGTGNVGPEEYRPEALVIEAYLQAARMAGADGVLAKPFQVQKLRQMVAQIAGNEAERLAS